MEILAVVLAVEHFENYPNGSEFETITDHKALFLALSPNHGKKTYHSRLTRWVDRLLPLNFAIKQLGIAGKDLGFTYLISRSAPRNAISPSQKEEEFVVATIKKFYKALNPTDIRKMI